MNSCGLCAKRVCFSSEPKGKTKEEAQEVGRKEAEDVATPVTVLSEVPLPVDSDTDDDQQSAKGHKR